ncbi:hypothetical protein KFV02_01490 [Desulfohalobiaceae bacterium Ax17]|jgi:hypothetical protein|uniref:hypothetical protein n=1 Tax=Desulfovulcanus ferrireducens TaxID=2831190 RepID=UPI00207BC42F|nr:hypothetical protein [Desulfovulcanus ferrireducens]MBT8762605.1 hypothetical protein [Desulfovulcanus ferrireducens]
MDQLQKQALQVTKEIVVKFIEIGRISPNNFPEFFSLIYEEVLKNISRPLSEQTEDKN